MRKVIISFLFAFIIPISVKGQITFVENFIWNPTTSIYIGDHEWTTFNGTTNRIGYRYPDLGFPGYVNSFLGWAIDMRPSGQDAFRETTVIDSTGSFYLSFVVRIDSARTGDFFIALLPAGSITDFNLKVYVKWVAPGKYCFGIGKSNAEDVQYNELLTFTTYTHVVVVAKYTFVPGIANDIVSLYAFSSGSFPSVEPSEQTVGPYVGTTSPDLANVKRVALVQGTSNLAPTLVLDGIQVSKQWNWLTVVNTISTVADKFSLSQNYPNPFNPSTTIKFSLPTNGMTSLKVYDLMGKEVSSLVNGNMSAGEFTTQFNGANLSSGMYFYKLEFNGVDGKSFSEQRKLMLVK